MTEIILDECPICGAVRVTVDRKHGIPVGDCGCMLTELQVRQHSGASKKEVASL